MNVGGSLLKPMPEHPLITSALGAVDPLARALAIELAPIRVNAVCPGLVDTEVRTIRAL